MNTTTLVLNITKKIFYLILPLCLLISLTVSARAYQDNEIILQAEPVAEYENNKGILVGGVSVTKDLPQEFYGTWSVVGVLEDTNRPELFKMRSSDIWTFGRKGDMITLSNPINGVSASITVNEVRGKTAFFSKEQRDEELYQIETPEITVEGDSFYGTDLIIMEHYKNGQLVKIDRVKYKVKGYKISGPTLNDIFAR